MDVRTLDNLHRGTIITIEYVDFSLRRCLEVYQKVESGWMCLKPVRASVYSSELVVRGMKCKGVKTCEIYSFHRRVKVD